MYTLVNGVPTLAPAGTGQALPGGQPPSILCYTLNSSNQVVPCLFSSGSGTINTGTTNQLAYYAAPGTTLSPLTLGTNLTISGGVLNASSTAATAFSAITGSTNNSGQAMIVGSTSSLSASGTGSISATTITGGATNDLVYQAGSGTTGFLAPVNNAVLVTGNTGIPSESTTLPSSLTIPSPTLSGTVAGANTIPLSILAQIAANSLLGNSTGGTANVTAAYVVGNSGSDIPQLSSGLLNNSVINWASPSAIGGTAAAAGTFTNLTATGTPTFTGIEGAGTYCLQISSAGVLSNTGSACGSGGSGLVYTSPTLNFIPKVSNATSPGTVVNSALDDGATTANTLTYTGAGGIVAPVIAADGTTPGAITVSAGTGNIPALGSNTFGLAAPAATFTSVLLKPSGAFTSAGILHSAASATGDNVNESVLTTSAVTPGDATGNTTGSGNFALAVSPVFTGTPDASGATQFKLPVAASYVSAANGEMGYDSTNSNWHGWNGADSIFLPLASGFTSGHCGQPTKTGNTWAIADTGSACGSGGSVTAVSVATANGVSGTSSGGATPALTIALGAITPTSVAASGPISATGGISSGSSPPTCTGNSIACFANQATPNTSASNVCSFQDVSNVLDYSCNGGTPAAVLYSGGPLGTPSGGTLTNATGLPAAAVVAGTFANGMTMLDADVGTQAAYCPNGGTAPSCTPCTTAATLDAVHNNQTIVLTNGDTCALTFTQPSTGELNVVLEVIQSSTSTYNGLISGGCWPTGSGFSCSATAPAVSATTGAVTFVTFHLDGTNAYGILSQ